MKKITIVGIGNGAQNAIDYLYTKNNANNINLAIINSDKNVLELAKTENKLLIHGEKELFYGLGCGGNPETGKQYAEYCIDEIEQLFLDTDFAVLISSFGGGCGTGATPVIAELLQNKGIPTIAIVSHPFDWEGELRQNRALRGLKKLEQIVEKVIVISNDDLSNLPNTKTTLRELFNYSSKKIAKLYETEIEKIN